MSEDGPRLVASKPWHQLVFVIGEALLSVLSGGLIFVLISRIAGPDLLGTYALALAWLLAFQGLSGFGIPTFVMREVGANGLKATDEIVHAMVLGAITGIVGICLMIAGARIAGYPAPLAEVIGIASLALIPSSITTACRSVFLALRSMHLTLIAVLVEVVLTFSISLYLILSGGGAYGLMLTLVVAKVASAAISLWFLVNRLSPVRSALSLRILRRTAATVFTFGIASTLGMLTVRINTIIVSLWVDIASVGQFAAATKIMEIGLIPPTLVVQLLLTRMAYSFNTLGVRDLKRFAAWFQVLFALVLPACVGGWIFAETILALLFGPGFEGAVWPLRILLAYLVIETADAAMSVTLQAAHMQRQDSLRFAFNPLVNIALTVALVPLLGTVGAALGRVAGGATSAALRSLFVARHLGRIGWFSVAAKPGVISIVMGGLCYSLATTVPHSLLLVGYCLGTLGLLVLSSTISPAVVRDLMSAQPVPEAGSTAAAPLHAAGVRDNTHR